MSRQIGPTVEILMRRIRQEGGLALSPDFATSIYSQCEQIVNTAFRRVLITTNLTVPKQKLLFTLRDEFPDAIAIVTFIQSNRELAKLASFAELSAYDPNWFRSIAGTRLEAWYPIGRDLFCLYPGQASSSTVEITYVKLLTYRTSFTDNYDENSDLPDEDVDIALALAELILLTRFHLLANVPARLAQAQALLTLRGFKI